MKRFFSQWMRVTCTAGPGAGPGHGGSAGSGAVGRQADKVAGRHGMQQASPT